MATYATDALAKARTDGLSSSQVSVLDYRGIAALCAVKVETNGNSPLDFFYVNVRRYVANTLWAEQLAAADAAMLASVKSKLTTAEDAWFEEKMDVFVALNPGISVEAG